MIYLNEPGRAVRRCSSTPAERAADHRPRGHLEQTCCPTAVPIPARCNHGTPVKAGWKAIVTKWFRQPRSD